MTPEYFNNTALNTVLRILPTKFDSPEARALVIAVCLQESRLTYRQQVGGPARSYAQFELGGVRGVLAHPVVGPFMRSVLEFLDYTPVSTDAERCYEAIEHNDMLCAAFTRLLLYTLPDPLPQRTTPSQGWKQYTAAWRPGKPKPETWNACFTRAWTAVDNGSQANG